MASIGALKRALTKRCDKMEESTKKSLTENQYKAGFKMMAQGSGWENYQRFIIPQLSILLNSLLKSRSRISILEIGPGPKSVLGHLPCQLRRKVKTYTAFEPNTAFSFELEKWLGYLSDGERPLPCLEDPPVVHKRAFNIQRENKVCGAEKEYSKYDFILFCHSMYGMKSKQETLEMALEMLANYHGLVVVFHRDVASHFDGLVCKRIAKFRGTIWVADDDEALDLFATFITGFNILSDDAGKLIRSYWREQCRSLGSREDTHPGTLMFSSPEVMMIFTCDAISSSELKQHVPWARERQIIKNPDAYLSQPATVFKPTNVQDVQKCVAWALKHNTSLTIIGGSHSGHCLQSNVVAIDMSAFNEVHVVQACGIDIESGLFNTLAVAEAGCTTETLLHSTLAAGATIPLGSRPSIGAGLWLQGGIGHLARLYGLSCDAIIGAIVVSVNSGHVFRIGHVPDEYSPTNAIRPEDEDDILWAMKGAGTNFAIVISVTFRCYKASTWLVREWLIPLTCDDKARLTLKEYEEQVAGVLPRNCSADAYIYLQDEQLRMSVTVLESTDAGYAGATPSPCPANTMWGTERACQSVDSIGLFETELYMSIMHSGHSGGKTSSFKRCVFLQSVSDPSVVDLLAKALWKRPSPLCYFHLIQGGGAICDVASDASAFGCRSWNFACVITGVWSRDQNNSTTPEFAKNWVYGVATRLLSLGGKTYSADLGPDPRDAELAKQAFGPNGSRLARLKGRLDPCNVLAYTCPLQAIQQPRLIILVTGDSCAGKDFCATEWVEVFAQHVDGNLNVRSVSISDAIKREYAAAAGVDLLRLLDDRVYKEQHRPALTAFFEKQLQMRPRLREEQFLNVIDNAVNVDILLITGLREEAPVAALSHLVPSSRLLDVRVRASDKSRQDRGACCCDSKDTNREQTNLKYTPSLFFDNDAFGSVGVRNFAQQHLLPYVNKDLERLADMIRSIPGFPKLGTAYKHVLGISEQPGGLALCTSLLQASFTGDWSQVDAIVCCEAGGFVFAPALALRTNLPLKLIRQAGKLPPPVLSIPKQKSYISSLAFDDPELREIEMEQGQSIKGLSMVVVDDVLSTGETLCAVLNLLEKAGIKLEDTGVLVVAEFPSHGGRRLLYERGHGKVNVQNLLVISGD